MMLCYWFDRLADSFEDKAVRLEAWTEQLIIGRRDRFTVEVLHGKIVKAEAELRALQDVTAALSRFQKRQMVERQMLRGGWDALQDR